MNGTMALMARRPGNLRFFFSEVVSFLMLFFFSSSSALPSYLFLFFLLFPKRKHICGMVIYIYIWREGKKREVKKRGGGGETYTLPKIPVLLPVTIAISSIKAASSQVPLTKSGSSTLHPALRAYLSASSRAFGNFQPNTSEIMTTVAVGPDGKSSAGGWAM